MIERLIDRHINDHAWLEAAVRAFLRVRHRIQHRKDYRVLRRAYAELDLAKAELDRKRTALKMEIISGYHADQWHRLVDRARLQHRTPADVWCEQVARRDRRAAR